MCAKRLKHKICWCQLEVIVRRDIITIFAKINLRRRKFRIFHNFREKAFADLFSKAIAHRAARSYQNRFFTR